MGWGATAKMKRIVCASATRLEAELAESEVVIFDMNAIGRQHFNYPANVSPREAVVRFWKGQVACQSATRLFGFHFDSSHMIPPERQDFLRNTRYKQVERDVFPEEVKINGRIYRKGQEPATDYEVDLMSESCMPVSYSRVWSSSKGKAKLWSIISKILLQLARTLTAANTRYIIEPPEGGRISVPGEPGPGNRWGEADQKAVALVREVQHEYPRVSVYTIDWDMIIAGCCVFEQNVSVRIARIFQEEETRALFYSAIGARGKLTTRIHEYVCPAAIGSPSVAWWMLAIGGVDYCKGLVRFGFSAQHLQELVVADDSVLLLTTPRRAAVDLRRVFEKLRGLPILRQKSSCPRDFVDELKQMCFCLLYFVGCGAERQRAGPDMTGFEIDVSGCMDIDDVLNLSPKPFYHRR